LASVIETLLAGLADGTIEPEPAEFELFPNLARKLELVFENSSRDAPPRWNVILSSWLNSLSNDHSSAARVVSDLDSLIQVARDLRRRPDSSLIQDLQWQTRLTAQKIKGIPINTLSRNMSEAARFEEMLAIAIDQDDSLLGELSIELQLTLAKISKTIIERAQSLALEKLKDLVRQLLPTGSTYEQRMLEDLLTPALWESTNPQIEHVQALIETLQLALKRIQATIPMRAAAISGNQTLGGV
jgi:hypothetical protein